MTKKTSYVSFSDFYPLCVSRYVGTNGKRAVTGLVLKLASVPSERFTTMRLRQNPPTNRCAILGYQYVIC